MLTYSPQGQGLSLSTEMAGGQEFIEHVKVAGVLVKGFIEASV